MVSLACTDHYFDHSKLEQMGRDIGTGHVVQLDPATREKLIPEIREAKRLMGLDRTAKQQAPSGRRVMSEFKQPPAVSDDPELAFSGLRRLLPLHLRRGLLRIYIAVSVPWIAFFGYRFLDALQRDYYRPYYQHRAFEAFWSLLIVPVGGPISLLLILWVLAGFRKSEQTAGEAKTGAKNDARPARPPPEGSSTDTPKAKSPPDYTEAGKVLGRIFLSPISGTK
jgi:hypothetical protein